MKAACYINHEVVGLSYANYLKKERKRNREGLIQVAVLQLAMQVCKYALWVVQFHQVLMQLL